MVNYDIWPMNIIAKRDSGKIKYWWIDPERCFWGDKMADFVCLEVYKPLKDKTASLNAYNAVAETPIEVNRETEIRYAVMAAYMGLLQEAEKYYRYTPAMFGWWRNVIGGAALFYKIGFGILKNG
jgi:fructosamine-3-kinase